MMLSVIIPALNEFYLDATIQDIHSKFFGEYEIIVVKDKPIRLALNEAVEKSVGDYILKLDAHCSVGTNFDGLLLKDCKEDEVMVASRYTLDLETWTPTPRRVDYYYLSCPWTHPTAFMMQSCPWISKSGDKKIDDLMCFQGSMWMMSRKHWNWLGGLEIGKEVYAEHHEISMKTWLGGRRVVINKNAWYAHPSKGSRGYHMSMRQVYKDHEHSAKYWTENKWEQRIHDYDWLIEKFWPLPTEYNRHRTEKYYWPADWRKFYDGTL